MHQSYGKLNGNEGYCTMNLSFLQEDNYLG